MYKLVSVGFEGVATAVDLLACAAKDAATSAPGVLRSVVDDVALGVAEMGNGERAVRLFAAIRRAARQQRGKFGYGDAVKLARENVVNALLQVRKHGLKTHD